MRSESIKRGKCQVPQDAVSKNECKKGPHRPAGNCLSVQFPAHESGDPGSGAAEENQWENNYEPDVVRHGLMEFAPQQAVQTPGRAAAGTMQPGQEVQRARRIEAAFSG